MAKSMVCARTCPFPRRRRSCIAVGGGAAGEAGVRMGGEKGPLGRTMIGVGRELECAGSGWVVELDGRSVNCAGRAAHADAVSRPFVSTASPLDALRALALRIGNSVRLVLVAVVSDRDATVDDSEDGKAREDGVGGAGSRRPGGVLDGGARADDVPAASPGLAQAAEVPEALHTREVVRIRQNRAGITRDLPVECSCAGIGRSVCIAGASVDPDGALSTRTRVLLLIKVVTRLGRHQIGITSHSRRDERYVVGRGCSR